MALAFFITTIPVIVLAATCVSKPTMLFYVGCMVYAIGWLLALEHRELREWMMKNIA